MRSQFTKVGRRHWTLAWPGLGPGPRVASLPKNRPVLTMRLTVGPDYGAAGQKICAAVGIVSHWLANAINFLLKFEQDRFQSGRLCTFLAID